MHGKVRHVRNKMEIIASGANEFSRNTSAKIITNTANELKNRELRL